MALYRFEQRVSLPGNAGGAARYRYRVTGATAFRVAQLHRGPNRDTLKENHLSQHEPAQLDGGAEPILRWLNALPDELSERYAEVISELQGFLHAFAAADLSESQMEIFRDTLSELRSEAEDRRVPETERRYGRSRRHRVGVYATSPEINVDVLDNERFEGTLQIGDYFLGVNGAAHGGIVTFIFDDVLGRLSAGLDRPPSRTAYLKTDFRAITPVNEPLRVRAWMERIEGRKRFLRGEILHGDVVCAEADALFVELLPGQP